MTIHGALQDTQAAAVLDFLGVTFHVADGDTLDRLIGAYARRVPWESASRIVRRADVRDTADCPRWPAHFWSEAMSLGTGGTCFESNYAFFALLRALGYDGYLTINDMGELCGCHTALVVTLDGENRLADVGIPLYTTLRVDPAHPVVRDSPFQRYTLRPLTPDRYEVLRAPHPRPIVYTLIDEPVDEADYCVATTADYGPNGQFLDRVILNKVVDGQIWRFASSDMPWHMETFVHATREDVAIEGDPAQALSARFGLDAALLRRALALVSRPERRSIAAT